MQRALLAVGLVVVSGVERQPVHICCYEQRLGFAGAQRLFRLYQHQWHRSVLDAGDARLAVAVSG